MRQKYFSFIILYYNNLKKNYFPLHLTRYLVKNKYLFFPLRPIMIHIVDIFFFFFSLCDTSLPFFFLLDQEYISSWRIFMSWIYISLPFTFHPTYLTFVFLFFILRYLSLFLFLMLISSLFYFFFHTSTSVYTFIAKASRRSSDLSKGVLSISTIKSQNCVDKGVRWSSKMKTI